MVYRNFTFNVVVRILLLCISLFLLFYCYFKTHWVITTFLVLVIFVYQVLEMIRYVNKVNRDLSRFLLAIKHRDFSQTFASDGRGKSFNELRDSFNLIINEFKRIKTEKEIHYNYLQIVIEHIGTGLISFDEKGHVELINRSAKKIFHMAHINTIQAFEKIDKRLVDCLSNIKAGENKLLKLSIRNELIQLSIYATELKIEDTTYKLVSFQNIKSELDEKEIDAWQKLIRVLTHEIMNSVTPISSLTSTTIGLLEDKEGLPIRTTDMETIQDIHSGLKTIEKRSKGLLNFVDTYRNLTKIPTPKMQMVSVNELVGRVQTLLKSDLERNKINLQVAVSEKTLFLNADAGLIEQVLINLLINAVDAVKQIEDPRITIEAYQHENEKIIVTVIDNGKGIDEEFIDKIFIPFFTTKENGSGIGLSLSRQIMRLHSGTISIQSEKEKGTVVTLKF